MKKLLNTLLEVRLEEKKDKGVIDGYNLTFTDPRINKIYKNVSNALISIDSASKEKDDIIQEISLAIIKHTPRFLENENITIEELIIEITAAKSGVAAKYFGYLNIKVVGSIKDKYKITNIESKKVIEEVFFKDIINGNFSEEQIADKLSMDYISYGSYSNFILWLKENGHKFLTNKQREYLENDMIGFTKDKHYKMRKNIAKRVLKYLNMNEYSTSNIKKMELMNQVKILESINSENFNIKLKANLDAPIVNDIIYSDLFTFAELKEITSFYNNVSSKLSFNLTLKILLAIENKKCELLNKIEKM
ncbi:TPA: hypothetical protein ACF2DS_002422 [Clostridium perfringens]|uniref:hypothetical protein n=1 Tax=Clostridium perfringens TaxID=1502 RepID=UPI000F5330DA|nr:hypothetical protein [Clostridium perfringens]EJT6339307.1 hypothetical protein [Clostridium perfringens]UBK99105.1 hypothetical protein KLF26_07725 [Clostridium perfringens]BDC01860.1 hypothetical protein CP118TE_15690 [Clostridium perfringens E]CAJ1610893.1 hypothetical protein CLO5623_02365 [Clostridium perfringens]